MKSAVFILPAAYQAAGNALAEAMGWGPDTYRVPLSPTGQLPATHYGCRADVSEEFIELLENPPAEAALVLAKVNMDLQEDMTGRPHWEMVLDLQGLQQIMPEETELVE